MPRSVEDSTQLNTFIGRYGSENVVNIVADSSTFWADQLVNLLPQNHILEVLILDSPILQNAVDVFIGLSPEGASIYRQTYGENRNVEELIPSDVPDWYGGTDNGMGWRGRAGLAPSYSLPRLYRGGRPVSLDPALRTAGAAIREPDIKEMPMRQVLALPKYTHVERFTKEELQAAKVIPEASVTRVIISTNDCEIVHRLETEYVKKPWLLLEKYNAAMKARGFLEEQKQKAKLVTKMMERRNVSA